MPAKLTEKAVKDRVKAIIGFFQKYHPAIYTFCPMTFGYGASGHPDRIILVGGHFLGVEIKKDANNYHCKPHLKPRPNEAMQARQAATIRAAGGEWVCIHSGNLDVLVDWLKTHAQVLVWTPAMNDALNKLTVM